MSPSVILSIIIAFFALLFIVSIITTRKYDTQSFYNANKRSPWYIISIAMIGTSISGVTFISVPGMIIKDGFSYMQMVLGFLFGYAAVAMILLPVFYKLSLTSIYTYLNQRFGFSSYKTGASFFLLSRTLGSAFRLYIVAIVLQKAVFDFWDIPFAVTVSITILLIFLYTRKGGMKTVIWTDTIQTLMLIGAMVLTIVEIANKIDLNFSGIVKSVADSGFAKIWIWDVNSPNYFWKNFLAGVFTVITMTGLDQDQMQKNLSCKNLKEAQKNMFTYGALFIPINLLFLSLGVLLVNFAMSIGVFSINVDGVITMLSDGSIIKGDELFPILATQTNPLTGTLFISPLVCVLFILGIISAAYSSADSALTALTTSFTIDIMGIKDTDPKLKQKRTIIHIGISIVLALVIIMFGVINDDSVINSIYTVAGYTYGPLLGLFAFGLMTKFSIKEKFVPFICILAPILSFLLNTYVFNFGFAILLVNGALTFLGLYTLRVMSSKK
ncbi:solute:sodium symporter (SSS) family transporter [Bacteroidia bacterium]|nr:solute:sodium symporter (SSS) family transporter [Bacteroidia bacterium]